MATLDELRETYRLRGGDDRVSRATILFKLSSDRVQAAHELGHRLPVRQAMAIAEAEFAAMLRRGDLERVDAPPPIPAVGSEARVKDVR